MQRLALVIAFALGAGLAWALAARTAPRTAVGPAPERWDEVLAALARIESQLGAAAGEVEPEPAPGQVAPQLPAPGSDQLLSEIRAAVEALRADLTAGNTLALRPWWEGFPETEAALRGGYDLLPLKEEQPEPNWEALRELIVAWNRDEQAARRSTLMLGYRDALERFGTPTEVWTNEKGHNWLYVDGVDPFTGENQVEVWLQFHDGFATQLGVKQP